MAGLHREPGYHGNLCVVGHWHFIKEVRLTSRPVAMEIDDEWTGTYITTCQTVCECVCWYAYLGCYLHNRMTHSVFSVGQHYKVTKTTVTSVCLSFITKTKLNSLETHWTSADQR